MLTKISGYTTKFVSYMRNNFLSFLFKSSVFLTLLSLIYLVCVLKQSHSVQKGHQIEVQQIARSQKLISRIPTRTESPVLPTEETATIYKSKTKERDSGGTNSFFSLPESTTFAVVSTDTTSPLPSTVEEKLFQPADFVTPAVMSIDVTSSLPLLETTTSRQPTEESLFQEHTTPVIISDSLLQGSGKTTLSYNQLENNLLLPLQDEHSSTEASKNMDHTTCSVSPVTTTHPLFPIEKQTIPPTEKTTQISTHTETTDVTETTPLVASPEKTTSLWDLLETPKTCTEAEISEKPAECAQFKRSLSRNVLRLFGNDMDSSAETTTAETESNPFEDSEETDTQSTPSPESNEIASTTPDVPESNDPFGYNDDAEETDSLLPTDNKSQSRSKKEPADTYFEDDESEPNDLEADHVDSPETSEDDAMLPNSNEDKLPPLNTDPFGFEDNLFNLFSFDHIPAMSNINPTRWSGSDTVPSKSSQVNSISQIADSADEINDPPRFLQRLQSFRPVNSLLNMKIKDSVSLLHRLFSNFRT